MRLVFIPSNAGTDVYIIILLRMIRLIGFGATSLILALFLKSLGIPEQYIGLFMTLTFIGDLVSSFLLSIITDQIGRKKMLLACSVLMTLTGAVFGSFENYYVLVITAILGILTPSEGKLVHLEQLSKVLLHHWFLMRRDQTFMLGIRFWEHFVLPLGHSWQEH